MAGQYNRNADLLGRAGALRLPIIARSPSHAFVNDEGWYDKNEARGEPIRKCALHGAPMRAHCVAKLGKV